jgi:Fic family protein
MPSYKLQAQIKREAEKIGEERGIQKKAKEMAQQLKNKGFTVSQIIELTGISKAQALKLKTEK